jgi:hypothetical protein
MTSPAKVIATPKGGREFQGIGEEFSLDLYTGTGNFMIPIAFPPGRTVSTPRSASYPAQAMATGPSGWIETERYWCQSKDLERDS